MTNLKGRINFCSWYNVTWYSSTNKKTKKKITIKRAHWQIFKGACIFFQMAHRPYSISTNQIKKKSIRAYLQI